MNLPAAIEQQLDPFDLSNPFPFYEQARREAPVFWSAQLQHWIVTRHDDVKEVLSDLKTFSAVKRWGLARIAFQWGDPAEDEKVKLAHDMVKYLQYCRKLVERRKVDLWQKSYVTCD